MSDELRRLLLDSLERVLRDQCPPERVQAAQAGGFDAGLWEQLAALGFDVALRPEAEGGIGAAVADLLAVLRVAAGYAAPVPLAESALLAPWLCARAALPVPDGILTVLDTGLASPTLIPGNANAWRIGEGAPLIAPAGRWADYLLLAGATVSGGVVACVPLAGRPLAQAVNLAGEARDRLAPDGLLDAASHIVEVDIRLLGALHRLAALARAAQMTGAMEAALARALDYAAERRQFGRPIAKFQAIQQQLALAAAEVAACQAAVDAAARNLDTAAAEVAVAAAKVRTGEAAATVSRIVHQVHGAMGFTQEYPLHHLTRRLWSWRDEFGSERAWAQRLGLLLARRGEVWQSLTALV